MNLRQIAMLALMVVGCSSYQENLATAVDVDGSNDHRIFRIGSITKLMMEPVIWQLEDSGYINLDRPVGEYFKDPLPPEFEKVTLRDLHDHRSGLPREFIDPWCLGDVYTAIKCGMVGSNIYADFDSREDFVRELWDLRWRSTLRNDGPRYSNMGYVLMMMAITDRTGMSLEELCERYLIRPYGLHDTSFAIREGTRDRLTMACAGHLPWLRFEGQPVHENRDGDVTKYAGGMLSSASDILKVCYVILPQINRVKGLFTEHRLAGGRMVYCRSGMIYGGNSFVGLDPQGGHAVVLLKNVTCWPTDEGLEIMKSLMEHEM